MPEEEVETTIPLVGEQTLPTAAEIMPAAAVRGHLLELELSDHLIISRYVCSNIVANIVTNIYMYVMRHVRM